MKGIVRLGTSTVVLMVLAGCNAKTEELPPMKESPTPADPDDIRKAIQVSSEKMGEKGRAGVEATFHVQAVTPSPEEVEKKKREEEKADVEEKE